MKCAAAEAATRTTSPDFRRVRDRRQRVGGEDRQRELLREERLVELARRPRPADEHALQVEALRPLGCDCHHLTLAARIGLVTPFSDLLKTPRRTRKPALGPP